MGEALTIKARNGGIACALFLAAATLPAPGASDAAFHRRVEPILKEYCYDCHADGANKGRVAFDEFQSDESRLHDRELWLRALRNVRAGLMPPPKKPQPTLEQKRQIEQWIKTDVFQIDPQNPDPGRVTVRRLNRVEYRNTIRDLLGVDFDTEKEFPPDDAGHGFDNIGDVLTLPPMLLEKYLAAAKTVIAKAVPSVPLVPAEKTVAGKNFSGEIGPFSRTNRNAGVSGGLSLSYYEKALVTNRFKAGAAGRYQLLLDFTANERYVDNQFDYNKCRLLFRVDGRELQSREYTREGGKAFHYEFDQEWKPGEHELTVEIEPLTPDVRQVRSLTLRLDSVTVRGPMDPKAWVHPPGYAKYFPREVPRSAAGRRSYAREILGRFAQQAYRRPVDARTLDRLVALAEAAYSPPGKTFEAGISQAMMGVLASPKFLFREEGMEPGDSRVAAGAAANGRNGLIPASGKSTPYSLVDEYALASRLSYLFWSSMPDEELFRLAAEGKLRANLAAQVKRMIADRKSEAFVRNFVGQWLQTRDIETVTIDARQVLNREVADNAPGVDQEREKRLQRFRELRAREETNEVSLSSVEKKEIQDLHDKLFNQSAQVVQNPPATARTNQAQRGFRNFRGPRVELTGDLRRAMRQETEKTVDYIIRENRSLVELLDSDYTFLNERLARHYGLTNLNLTGEEMVLVKLPEGSPRGGVITHGSVLAVTSNPTRTSPVKRGLFILDNLLGTPPAPPPPDIPPLEDAAKAVKDRKLTLRETLALHREEPRCASCHNRMDPLGLALDNFNAMGMWRDQEKGQPIDPTGKLLSGESFTNVTQLKKILAANHATEFYRTVTEKLLIYALGRGLEYYDVGTVDAIVARLEKSGGRPSEWIAGVVESAPFQKTRRAAAPSAVQTGDAGGAGVGQGDRASRAP